VLPLLQASGWKLYQARPDKDVGEQPAREIQFFTCETLPEDTRQHGHFIHVSGVRDSGDSYTFWASFRLPSSFKATPVAYAPPPRALAPPSPFGILLAEQS
jgi:hypothetical protein